MSLSGRGYSFFFKDAIDYAFEAGVLLVAASGNDSKRVLSYPSAYNGVVSVAASTGQDGKAKFSNSGFWNSVAAPGVRILSAYPTYETPAGQEPYVELQGTSMASPHVCGAVALLLSRYPNLTPLELINQLEATARPGQYGDGFSEELGYGIINCEALLGDLQPMRYGGLRVETNIAGPAEDSVQYGLITVYDESGRMVYFGATGEDGNHNFNAMLAGTYTVTLSFEDRVHTREIVTIDPGEFKTIMLII